MTEDALSKVPESLGNWTWNRGTRRELAGVMNRRSERSAGSWNAVRGIRGSRGSGCVRVDCRRETRSRGTGNWSEISEGDEGLRERENRKQTKTQKGKQTEYPEVALLLR